MKRLDQIMRRYKNHEKSFDAVYEGPMIVHHGTIQWGEDSPRYYDGGRGFLFERSGKEKLMLPTVTVSIPISEILEDSMKRLKNILLKMENDTATYRYRSTNDPSGHQKSLYDGEALVHFPPKSDGDSLEPELQSMPVFYDGEIGYEITSSGKSAQDKPTVTAQIPLDEMAIDAPDARIAAAAADCLLREFARFVKPYNDALYNRSRPDKENGRYYIHEPGGEVLVRNSAYFSLLPTKDYVNMGGIAVRILSDDELRPPAMHLCIRMQIQLPEKKLRRTIEMLTCDLPSMVRDFVNGFDRARLHRAIALAERQNDIRTWLRESDYCAFIANGAILPRDGETQNPKPGALPFSSVKADEIEVAGVVGMGIKRGVTVITGGGYSGKSTLLDAIAAGIYDHVEGDGRELVITDESAVSIAAEDGRSVKHVDISPFLGWLPMDGDTSDFSTAHASGSTSQAANIVEAVSSGCRLMLIDEDRSATNFMIRDEKMKKLIEREPITPLTDRVRELARAGVSTILVIGGSGEYLAPADRVYMMDDFVIRDATDRAKTLAGSLTEAPACSIAKRACKIPDTGFSPYPQGLGSERLSYSKTRFIEIGSEYIDTRALHEIVTHEQANALAFILRALMLRHSGDGLIDIGEAIDSLYAELLRDGMDAIWSNRFCETLRFMDLPRKCDVIAAIRRMRGI